MNSLFSHECKCFLVCFSFVTIVLVLLQCLIRKIRLIADVYWKLTMCQILCSGLYIYINSFNPHTTHKTKYVYDRYFTDDVTETWIGKLLAERDRVRMVMRAKLETWAAPSQSVLRTFIGSSVIPFTIIGTWVEEMLGARTRAKDTAKQWNPCWGNVPKGREVDGARGGWVNKGPEDLLIPMVAVKSVLPTRRGLGPLCQACYPQSQSPLPPGAWVKERKSMEKTQPLLIKLAGMLCSQAIGKNCSHDLHSYVRGKRTHQNLARPNSL